MLRQAAGNAETDVFMLHRKRLLRFFWQGIVQRVIKGAKARGGFFDQGGIEFQKGGDELFALGDVFGEFRFHFRHEVKGDQVHPGLEGRGEAAGIDVLAELPVALSDGGEFRAGKQDFGRAEHIFVGVGFQQEGREFFCGCRAGTR